MRFRTSMSVTLCVFAVGLGVAGCSPGGSSSTSSGSATDSSTNSGSSTPATAQQSQAAASGGLCQPANLSITLGAKTGGTSQTTQVVDLTNKGSSACTMQGFPGVNLVGVANGQQNYTWPLTRSSASYASESNQGISKVTLQPGGTAHFDLRYLPGAPGDNNKLINVDKMVITPPNDYSHAEVTWQQDVVLQDAATHPGTYIMPVVSGS